MATKANIYILILSVFIVTIFGSSLAIGKTIYVDDDAAGLNDGSSWQNAYVYLQDALTEANNSQKPVEIRVAQGTYTPDLGFIPDENTEEEHGMRESTFRLYNDIELRGGYAGISAIDPNERDYKLYETILSGDLNRDDIDVNTPNYLEEDASRQENCFHVITSDSNSVIDGFVITGGIANAPQISSFNTRRIGGAIFNTRNSQIMNCIFKWNFASSDGGAIYNNIGDLQLKNCVFLYNASMGRGGALHIVDNKANIIDCSFENNNSSDGGGIFSHNSSVNLDNCDFMYNKSSNTGGGLLVLNMSIMFSKSAKINNCRFICNSSDQAGGGISAVADEIIISNCLFCGNKAVEQVGGGCDINSDNLTIANCTSVWDEAEFGGFLSFMGKHGDIFNSIIWYNDNPIEKIGPRGTCLNVYFSNIEGGQEEIMGTWQGNIDKDPLFVDPVGQDQIEGTEDDDLRLLATSPCINSGNQDYTIDPNETDLDGNQRIVSNHIDMGAYEFQNVIYVDNDANGLNDGSSWQNAYNYLQDALNSVTTNYEIRIAQGCYTPDIGFIPDENTKEEYGTRDSTFRLHDYIAIRGGYAGIIAKNPNERDYELYETILSGDLNGDDIDVNAPDDLEEDVSRQENCFHIITSDSNSVIDGFVITGGIANAPKVISPNTRRKGGAIYNTGNSQIMNCIFKWNNASSYGGSIYNDTGNLHLTNCDFSYNFSRRGAGLYTNNSVLDIKDCSFKNNNSEIGGGINCIDSDIDIANCDFLYNYCSSMGGGLSIENNNAYINNCRFTCNISGGLVSGGSIFDLTNNIIISNCLFNGNRNGGIYSESDNFTMTNCTSVWNSTWSTSLYGSFLTYKGNNGYMLNTIVRHDTIKNSDKTLSINYSNILGNWEGQGNIDMDPLFVDTFGPDHTGGTEDDDLRLAPMSPCVDSGELIYEDIFTETDLDGNPRSFGENIDMGAYEFQGDLYVDASYSPNAYSTMDGSRTRPFNNIQEAIDFAKDSFTINVLPGIYDKINFMGKAITVTGYRGAATIQTNGDAVTFHSGENANSVLKNFILCNSDLAISLNYGSSPTIHNITIANNLFGIAAYEDSNPDIRNCIFYNNIDGGLFGCESWYSLVQSSNRDNYNFGVNPYFVDEINGDYHLKSEGWRWSENSKSWTWDEVTSFCIDTGDPNMPLGDEPMTISRDPNNKYGRNKCINVGAYGGTSQASMPPVDWGPIPAM